jgi:hypothetical protein
MIIVTAPEEAGAQMMRLLPADGAFAARSLSDDLGLSRFKGSYMKI